MPPPLALVLTIGFVVFLFRRDARQDHSLSGALWLPVIWIFLIASRFVSGWLAILGWPLGGAGSLEEGSPIDAMTFLVIILAGMAVLARRGITLPEVLRNNVWVALFLAFCFVSILWSDFPFVAFKRWIKILGHPVMALIILTDPRPEAALRRVFKRSAFLLIPLSITFIKYFPQFGRGFEYWSGTGFNRGVMLNKNELGYVCLVFGLFFAWSLLTARRLADQKARREELILCTGLLAMILWLLLSSRSATSLACFLIGTATLSALGFRFVSKRRLGTVVLVFAAFAISLQSFFDVYATVVQLFGRDPTLTDRTEVWADVLELADFPILGAGFESFWLGHRLEVLWTKWWWRPTQAHNGYIELYINLGAVGLVVFLGLILATFHKCRRALLADFDLGRLRMAFLFAILAYNYTEAAFKGVSLLWTIFHIVAMDWPAARGISRNAMPGRSLPSSQPADARPVENTQPPVFSFR